MDIKLATNGDIDFSTDDLVILEGVQSVAQHIKTRLRFGLGEWLLDTRLGVPWLENILGAKPTSATVNGILFEVISGTPGVDSVSSLSSDYNGITRELSITFQAQTAEGPIVFEDFLIFEDL